MKKHVPLISILVVVSVLLLVTLLYPRNNEPSAPLSEVTDEQIIAACKADIEIAEALLREQQALWKEQGEYEMVEKLERRINDRLALDYCEAHAVSRYLNDQLRQATTRS